MATTPISEIIATIEVVRELKETVAGLVGIVEKLGERIERLERNQGVSNRPPRSL